MSKGILPDMEKQTKLFVSDMNAFYKKKYLTENKGKDPKTAKDMFPLLTFGIGKARKARRRDGDLQGYLLAQRKPGKTKTSQTAHLSGGALHVPVKINGELADKPSKIEKALGAKAFKEFTSQWVKTMDNRGLLNADRKKAWYPSDAFHLEYPNSRPPQNDPDVIEALQSYVEEVGEDYTRINPALERKVKSNAWAKKIIDDHRQKLNLRTPDEMKKEPRDVQVSVMLFDSKNDAKAQGQKLLPPSNKSTKKSSVLKGNFVKNRFVPVVDKRIIPVKQFEKDLGPATKAPCKLSATVKLDDLGVTLVLTLQLDFETFKPLKQTFLRSATLSADMTKAKTADAKLKVSATYDFKLSMKTTDSGPKGHVTVKYFANGPGKSKDKKGSVVFDIDGKKSKTGKIT